MFLPGEVGVGTTLFGVSDSSDDQTVVACQLGFERGFRLEIVGLGRREYFIWQCPLLWALFLPWP